MKRIISIIVMMLISLGAFAQISSVKTTEAIKTISKFRGGNCFLKAQGDTYYLALITTNRFDDAIIVFLGEGKESAIKTLQDLQELHQSMNKGDFADFSIKIKDNEYSYHVSKFDRYNFAFHSDEAAGVSYLATMEMKSLISKLGGE